MNGITNSYESKNAVASSLIGNVGSADGVQINLSFLNISLPDHAVGKGGIFTHATLLESFKHNGSSSVATYNFYQADDRENGSYKHRNVTYGKEYLLPQSTQVCRIGIMMKNCMERMMES